MQKTVKKVQRELSFNSKLYGQLSVKSYERQLHPQSTLLLNPQDHQVDQEVLVALQRQLYGEHVRTTQS